MADVTRRVNAMATVAESPANALKTILDGLGERLTAQESLAAVQCGVPCSPGS
jgi:hypothetical protein